MTSEITDQLFSNCVCKKVEFLLGQSMFAQNRFEAELHKTMESSQPIIFRIR